MAELTPQDRARRLAARRTNERLKLIATALNAVSVATVGAAFILPAVNGASGPLPLIWIPMAVGLHLAAQGVFHFLRSED
mgnify:CR=1 FL=1